MHFYIQIYEIKMTLHSFAKLVKFNTFYDVWAVENRLQLAQKGYEELVPIYKI